MTTNKPIYTLIALGMLLASCTGGRTDESTPTPVSRQHEAFVLQPIAIQTALALPAELKPFEDVYIYPKASGFVRQIPVDRGSLVKKGSLLAVIEAPEVFADIAEAEANIQRAEGNSQRASAAYRSSRDTYERTLVASATPGALSQSDLIKVTNKMREDSAQYTMAQSELTAARSVHDARRQLSEYLTIRAPFDGVVTERNVHTGAYVGAGRGENQALFRLEANHKLRLVIPVPENHAGIQFAKDTVNFTVNSNPGKIYRGVISRKAGSLSAQTRTEIIEADVDNSTGELKGGSFAQVSLPYRKNSTFMVPVSAVVTTMEDRFVVKVVNGKAERVSVRKGMTIEGKVEIFGDLAAGDTLLARPSETIQTDDELETKQMEVTQP